MLHKGAKGAEKPMKYGNNIIGGLMTDWVFELQYCCCNP